MITTDILQGQAARTSPTEHTDWRWGYRIIGDPLLRADDKFVGAPGTLVRMVKTLRDPRARAEIRVRAERKLGELEAQLADLRGRDMPDLEAEAARELEDQRTFVSEIAEPED